MKKDVTQLESATTTYTISLLFDGYQGVNIKLNHHSYLSLYICKNIYIWTLPDTYMDVPRSKDRK